MTKEEPIKLVKSAGCIPIPLVDTDIHKAKGMWSDQRRRAGGPVGQRSWQFGGTIDEFFDCQSEKIVDVNYGIL
jgi:hypothetical protein